MSILIIMFGALTFLAGTVILVEPEIIFGFLRKNIEKLELHIAAVLVRIVIGVLLLSQSDVSRFPFIIEIVGWLSIIAAAVFAVMGRSNFIKLMLWALSVTRPMGRFGGVIAGMFGAFLIYAFV